VHAVVQLILRHFQPTDGWIQRCWATLQVVLCVDVLDLDWLLIRSAEQIGNPAA
jgi:hypothetical protein